MKFKVKYVNKLENKGYKVNDTKNKLMSHIKHIL